MPDKGETRGLSAGSAPPLTRRGLLLALPALAVAACRRRPPPDETAERLIAAAVRTRRGAWARVGEAYLAAHPAEADPGHLTSELVRELGWQAFAGTELLRARIAEAIAEDFHQGRTTRVEGWLLSRTEARIAAVVALYTPASS